jgi:hypothetical protein
LSPQRRREAVTHVRARLKVSDRRACLVLGQARTTPLRELRVKDDEPRLVAELVELVGRFGRHG